MSTKRFLCLWMTLVAMAALLLTACGTASEPESADPLTVVQGYFDALQAKDVDKAMAFAADDMVAADPTGYYYGKEEIAGVIHRLLDIGASFEESDFKASGNRVTSCYKYYENGSLLDQGCNNVTHVRDGKVIFDGPELMEPRFVVQEFYDALNAKDVDTAMSWVAPDALFANPTGRYEGADAIRASLESQVRDGITFDLGTLRMVAGSVVYDFKVMSGDQVLDSGDNGLTTVEDGLIVFDGTEDTKP